MRAVQRARAKVNLWLNVVGRRADGYHLLESLVAFADLADSVEATSSDGLSLDVDVAPGVPGAADLGATNDNLVLKAARLLADRSGVSPRAALRLTKRIPIAAGLGGGSADAAAALQALVELWRLALPVEELFDLAARLGADVPMCLAGKPSLVTGVGETLAAAPALPPCAILLANPGVALPTADVFRGRRADFSVERPAPTVWPDLDALVGELAERGNDLAAPAIELRPVIGELLALLRTTESVRYVAMSGSGATCFALYETVAEARAAALRLPTGWWHHAGTL